MSFVAPELAAPVQAFATALGAPAQDVARRDPRIQLITEERRGGTLELLVRLAERLRGRRFVHVNASRYGGGSPELLNRLDSGATKEILEDIGQQDVGLADKVRHLRVRVNADTPADAAAAGLTSPEVKRLAYELPREGRPAPARSSMNLWPPACRLRCTRRSPIAPHPSRSFPPSTKRSTG